MKKKIDVLFLCQYFYPEYVSSATLPYDTARALVKAGFSVSALCGYPVQYNKDGEVPIKEVYEGIEIKRLKYIQLKRNDFIWRIIKYFSFIFVVSLRFLDLKNYKTIIVYSNPPVLPFIAALASKFFKVKMIFVCYDVYPEIAWVTNSISRDGFISKTMQFVNNVIYKQVDKVVALSCEMKEYLLANRKQLLGKRIIVIPNWYKENLIEDASKSYLNKKFISLNPNENFIVSYLGNMGIGHDLNTILNAIRFLKNDHEIKFVFAGHGNKMNQLRKAIEKEDLNNVTVYGSLSEQDFQDALIISDSFLVCLAEGVTGLSVPSKTYRYMMSGKPVIAILGMNSDISRDILDNNAGYALEIGEVDKLVASIMELKENEQLRTEMGNNINRIFKEKYEEEKCTSQYIKLIKEVLCEK